jgi:hypothetical protein
MSPNDVHQLLTTTQAAKLTQRPERSIRKALASQVLAGFNDRGKWFVRRDDLLVWDKHTGRRHREQSSGPWERAAASLAEYGSLNADELAQLVGVHPGNARKHLAILAKQGRAERLPDGQWVPTALEHNGAA